MMKEQEKYKKRFKNSLKNNKNKWKSTNNGFESKSKKEAAFECEDIKVAEQLTSAGKNTTIDNITTNFQELEIREQDIMLSWQEILCKEIPITRPEFHRGLNSIRDLKILMTYCDGVRNKRLAYKMTYAYVIGQCAIRARKIKSDS
ncbi:unnamed protein product [Rhizophagus irregularis]|nr:unnamed protein product [Rhizophagus irregularis]